MWLHTTLRWFFMGLEAKVPRVPNFSSVGQAFCSANLHVVSAGDSRQPYAPVQDSALVCPSVVISLLESNDGRQGSRRPSDADWQAVTGCIRATSEASGFHEGKPMYLCGLYLYQIQSLAWKGWYPNLTAQYPTSTPHETYMISTSFVIAQPCQL